MKVEIKKSFKGFNLQIQFKTDSKRIALFGPSGSGKSLTLKTILGIISPDIGSIEVEGKELKAIPPFERRCGFVFQELALFPHLNVWKNISSSRNFDSALAEKLFNDFGISSLKEKKIHKLSGGQKQRVAIIRALASQPNYLLLDEPFSFLDHETKKNILTSIKNFCKQKNIPAILVTHDMNDVRDFAQECFHIQDGRIL